jgi:hypothetical protein
MGKLAKPCSVNYNVTNRFSDHPPSDLLASKWMPKDWRMDTLPARSMTLLFAEVKLIILPTMRSMVTYQ